MTTDLATRHRDRAAVGLVEFCLPEAMPAPVDDTLEADQFRCVACGAVTWEHDHDGHGECPDCAATATSAGAVLPVPITSAGPSARWGFSPSAPTAAVDLAQVLDRPTNRTNTPARTAQETTP